MSKNTKVNVKRKRERILGIAILVCCFGWLFALVCDSMGILKAARTIVVSVAFALLTYYGVWLVFHAEEEDEEEEELEGWEKDEQ